MAEIKIEDFVLKIKAAQKPFAYLDPIQDQWFMLSYDNSNVDYGDFRLFIIAALRAKGVTTMKSQVASTIIFKDYTTETFAGKATTNWKNYLNTVFGKDLTFVIGALRYYAKTDKPPVYDYIENNSIKNEFEERLIKIEKLFA